MSEKTKFWFWVYRWSRKLSDFADTRAMNSLEAETPSLTELLAKDTERLKAQQNTSTTDLYTDTSSKWMGRSTELDQHERTAN